MFRNRWFHGSFSHGLLPADCVADCSASGPVDDAVEYWVRRLDFDGPPWMIRHHLRGYGAWSTADLCDHQANRRRLLWIWACNCCEGDSLLVLE
ncbi:hypothetical protein [Synechococcus sp. CBW1004]|jgi:hypothetical protein|uniref:hypothetical protein n=1 Tax=Synechococcus sp. CBW1004 TaxID=1353136 RepID=UPI0018CE2A33|nr:hypothetical protein [Synechococcus sp. CBW1004]QPN63684.1 hypothetical protein H8F25_02040 [Synechococcus sp. CBW1004]